MSKPKAVLDTNYLYYLAGESTDAKIASDWVDRLTSTHDLVVASPTVVEVLTRPDLGFENRIRCLKTICSDRITALIQIAYLPYELEILKEFVNNPTTQGLENLQVDALRRKIRCEAQFLRFVQIVLFTAFLDAIYEDRKSSLNEKQQADLTRHFDVIDRFKT